MIVAVLGVSDKSPTATVAFAVAEESATLVAVTLWLPGCAGAVYNPLEEIVPVVEFPLATPSTDHVTEVFELFVTVAVNCVVPLTATFAEVWFNVTLTAGGGGVVVVVVVVPLEPVPPQLANTRATARLEPTPKNRPREVTFIESAPKKNQRIDGRRAVTVAAFRG